MDLTLVEQIRSTLGTLPDCRKQGNNQKYAVEDAALSAFSVFFTQSPSFLDYQRRMQKHYNRNNAQSVFGVHQIPKATKSVTSLTPSHQKRCIRCWRRWVTGYTNKVVWHRSSALVVRCWWHWTAPTRSVRKRFPVPAAPGNC